MTFSSAQCLEALDLIPAEGLPRSEWYQKLRQLNYTKAQIRALFNKLTTAPVCRIARDANDLLIKVCSFNVDPNDNRTVDPAELQWL